MAFTKSISFALLVLSLVGGAWADERHRYVGEEKGGRPDCNHPDRIFIERSNKLLEHIEMVTRHGRARKAECLALAETLREKCMEELVPLRQAIRADWLKLDSVRVRFARHSAVCSMEKDQRHKKNIQRGERIASESCSGGIRPDSTRCENALFELAKMYYEEDAYDNREERERYEKDVQKWKANQNLD